jgi:hypothetical protein
MGVGGGGGVVVEKKKAPKIRMRKKLLAENKPVTHLSITQKSTTKAVACLLKSGRT